MFNCEQSTKNAIDRNRIPMSERVYFVTLKIPILNHTQTQINLNDKTLLKCRYITKRKNTKKTKIMVRISLVV